MFFSMTSKITSFSSFFMIQRWLYERSKWTYDSDALTGMRKRDDNIPFKILVLRYLFIRFNVSFYILMIHKWSKITTWFAFCLNAKDIAKTIASPFLQIFLHFRTFIFFVVCKTNLHYLLLAQKLLYFPKFTEF